MHPTTVLAVIYARVSTNVQGDNYSFAAQLDACRAFAQHHGMTVTAEFQEVASGATLGRPELEQARGLLRSGAARALIVASIDRLSRNLGQLLYLTTELQHVGATLYTATSGASGTDVPDGLSAHVDAAFAEYERTKIKERLLSGRLHKITGTAGKPAQVYGNGNAPYGYRYEGRKRTRRLTIDATEAVTVREIFAMCVQSLSVHAIADRLNDRGVPTPAQNGRASVTKRTRLAWNGAIVHRILRNDVYAGTMYFNKTHRVGTRDIQHPRDVWIPVPVPAIITPMLASAVRERLTQRRKSGASGAQRFYLLGQRRLRCQCGYTMTGTGSTKERWWAYRCTHDKRERDQLCTLGFLPAELVEHLIWSWLADRLTPEHIQAGMAAHSALTAHEDVRIDQARAQVDLRRKALSAATSKLIAAYQADVLSLDELGREKAVIDAERASLDQEYARLEALQRDARWPDGLTLLAEAPAIRTAMPQMTNDDKAALLDRLAVTVVRRLADDQRQVLAVDSRIGSARVPLDVPVARDAKRSA